MNDTAISLRLGAWWEANARDLPWRFGRATPWGVLVSEVMSQQTQMSRVVPYWTDWMERWPDARALAEAPKAEVITAWGRLGYPRRALRLQECARVVAEQYADKLPRTYDELTALPGIGDYTASAVLSFAFGERIAVIEVQNDLRMFAAQLFGIFHCTLCHITKQCLVGIVTSAFRNLENYRRFGFNRSLDNSL